MSRDAMLRKIRQALGQPRYGDALRIAAAEGRLAQPSRHPIPSRVQKARSDIVELFKSNMRQQSADVFDVAGPSEVPKTVRKYLGTVETVLQLQMGLDPYLDSMPWRDLVDVSLSKGRADPKGGAGVSLATSAIAETGTLMLASGADNPATLAFLPDTHIVIVREETITGPFEEAFDLLRTRYGRRVMPRSLNLISAPSRTGDIGGKIVLGAHGPRRLAVIIVKSS